MNKIPSAAAECQRRGKATSYGLTTKTRHVAGIGTSVLPIHVFCDLTKRPGELDDWVGETLRGYSAEQPRVQKTSAR